MRKNRKLTTLRLDRETIRQLDEQLVAVSGAMPRRDPTAYPCPSALVQCRTGAIDCPSRWTFCD
jgi:hypothetical protein